LDIMSPSVLRWGGPPLLPLEPEPSPLAIRRPLDIMSPSVLRWGGPPLLPLEPEPSPLAMKDVTLESRARPGRAEGWAGVAASAVERKKASTKDLL
jgi:hypothetical protein